MTHTSSGEPRYDGQIVGDPDERRAGFAAQLPHRNRIWPWMVTSSAVVGSSAMTTSGGQQRDRDRHALSMPPESWCG